MKTYPLRPLLMALAMVGAAAAGGGQSPIGDWDFTAQAEIVPDRSGNGNGLSVEGCQWVQALNLMPRAAQNALV